MSTETVYRCDSCRRTPGSKGENPTGPLRSWRLVYVGSDVANPDVPRSRESYVDNKSFHLCEACLLKLAESIPPNVKLR